MYCADSKLPSQVINKDSQTKITIRTETYKAAIMRVQGDANIDNGKLSLQFSFLPSSTAPLRVPIVSSPNAIVGTFGSVDASFLSSEFECFVVAPTLVTSDDQREIAVEYTVSSKCTNASTSGAKPISTALIGAIAGVGAIVLVLGIVLVVVTMRRRAARNSSRYIPRTVSPSGSASGTAAYNPISYEKKSPTCKNEKQKKRLRLLLCVFSFTVRLG